MPLHPVSDPPPEDNPEPVTINHVVAANADLEQVAEILKASRDQDPLVDKSSFYPLQQKTQYKSPVCTLSSESKRIIRQAQAPILQASPRVVHFLYEVSLFIETMLLLVFKRANSSKTTLSVPMIVCLSLIKSISSICFVEINGALIYYSVRLELRSWKKS